LRGEIYADGDENLEYLKKTSMVTRRKTAISSRKLVTEL